VTVVTDWAAYPESDWPLTDPYRSDYYCVRERGSRWQQPTESAGGGAKEIAMETLRPLLQAHPFFKGMKQKHLDVLVGLRHCFRAGLPGLSLDDQLAHLIRALECLCKRYSFSKQEPYGRSRSRIEECN
jgi:hypothetical protein